MRSIIYTFVILISLTTLQQGYATQPGEKEEAKPLKSPPHAITQPVSGISTTAASDEEINTGLLSPFISMREEPTNIPNTQNITSFQTNSPSLPSEYWGVSQQEVDFLFENSSDYIAISGIDRFKKVNKVLQEASGWNEEELTSSPHGTFEQPDHVREVKSFVKFMATKLSAFGFEAKARRKDGSTIWIQWLTLAKISSPLENEKDRTFFCIGRDITQQKEQEAARIKILEDNHKAIEILYQDLDKQNKILRAISEIQSSYINKGNLPQKNVDVGDYNFSDHYGPLETILQHFIQLSESEYGFIGEVFFDKEYPFVQQVFGVRNRGAINKETEEALNLYKQRGRCLCNFDNIIGEVIKTKKSVIINNFETYPLSSGIPLNHPFPIKAFLGIPLFAKDQLVGMIALANRNEGYSNELLLWLAPLTLSVGNIVNGLKIGNWRKEAETQKMARKEAEEANEAKSAFLAHMSHEIRTPLTGILGLLDLIQEESIPGEDRNYLETARASGMSLMGILNNILDISKIESHQVGLEKIKVNPIKIAQELIQLYYPEAKKQETKLTLNINPEVPTRLIGDPVRLRQILSNLISNAVKFTKNGSVSITLTGQECENNAFCLSGVVTDTGIGIQPEMLSHLFQPFMQADKSIMRQFGGSGLGLYITKALCEIMGGEVKATSQVGVSSTFQFTMLIRKVPVK
jgi:PAS domain S-box-containing protein